MRSVEPKATLDPTATRAAILDAATALFAEKGFAATSLWLFISIATLLLINN